MSAEIEMALGLMTAYLAGGAFMALRYMASRLGPNPEAWDRQKTGVTLVLVLAVWLVAKGLRIGFGDAAALIEEQVPVLVLIVNAGVAFLLKRLRLGGAASSAESGKP